MVTARTRMVLPLALAAVGIMALASLATASHPRPKGATPIRVPLVPAYKPCTAPNRTHGPPLAFPSCNPPAHASDFVTVGTPDTNGAAANSFGSIRIDVVVGVPGPPDDTDLLITPTIGDVRCKGATTSCGNANDVGGRDYTGGLEGHAIARVTDHFNAAGPGGGTDPATVVDMPFPISISCASTADTSIGSLCKASTATCLGCFPRWEGHRAVAEITQIKVYDGGPDGVVGTADGNSLFAVQGLFVP